MTATGVHEGSLQAPTRHPLDWKSGEFWDEARLYQELERVYGICHGCRRCVSLCHAFPTLFDLVDESDTLEVDGVARSDYWKVVDHCYLCDLCYMTKCPYVPPHEWNLDFPHLMLRAKAVRYKKKGTSFRNRMLTATDTVGKLAGIPIVSQTINAMNRVKPVRKILQATMGIHADAIIPRYHSRTLRKRVGKGGKPGQTVEATDRTRGQVALFVTCYGNYNEPDIGRDLISVFEYNGIPVILAEKEQCCGMPKLEIGDLEAVERAKKANIPVLAKLVDRGYDLVAPVPSCVLMFKQELPLMFPHDKNVIKVRDTFFDPFEYLMLRHKAGKLKTEFKQHLGRVAYHVPCHQRVQNIGLKTRDILALIPDTHVEVIERCSGHDGTYAVKKEFHDISTKICRPVVSRIKKAKPDRYTSDCPMAGHQIENGLKEMSAPEHPLTLLRKAYGI